MKAYFIGLVIMSGCLLYGCHTKQKKGENSSDYSADSQSIARQDTLPLPTDTHAASSVSTEVRLPTVRVRTDKEIKESGKE